MKATLLQFIKNFEDYIGGILIVCIIVLAFLQVLFRYVLKLPLAWTEDYVIYGFVWMTYMGASSCTKSETHLKVEMFYDKLSPKAQYIVKLAGNVLWLVFSLVMLKYSYDAMYAMLIRDVRTVGTNIPVWAGHAAVVLGMALMSLHLIINMVRDFKKIRKKGNV